jgi:hypothetical protein
LWWQVLVPRTAVALVVVVAGWFGYHRYQVEQRQKRMAESLAVVATVQELPSAEALEDFDAIRGLSSTPAADEELLALNEDLLALMP